MALAGKAAEQAAKVNLLKEAQEWFIVNGILDHTDVAMLVSTDGEMRAGIVDIMLGDGKNEMKKRAQHFGSAAGTSIR